VCKIRRRTRNGEGSVYTSSGRIHPRIFARGFIGEGCESRDRRARKIRYVGSLSARSMLHVIIARRKRTCSILREEVVAGGTRREYGIIQLGNNNIEQLSSCFSLSLSLSLCPSSSPFLRCWLLAQTDNDIRGRSVEERCFPELRGPASPRRREKKKRRRPKKRDGKRRILHIAWRIWWRKEDEREGWTCITLWNDRDMYASVAW